MDGYVCGYIHPPVPQVTSEKSISSCLCFPLLRMQPGESCHTHNVPRSLPAPHPCAPKPASRLQHRLSFLTCSGGPTEPRSRGSCGVKGGRDSRTATHRT